jgi:hypothetical protein
MATTSAEPDIVRLRPLYVLDILSPRMRSDVLSDGSIAAKFDLHLKIPTRLTEDVVVLRGDLLGALRSAVDNLPVPKIRDQSSADTDIKVEVNSDGSGTIEADDRRLRFGWVTLLSSDPQKRLAALNIFLTQFPVDDASAEFLREIVQRSSYSDADFVKAVALLESSPEMFCERLREKLRRSGDNRFGLDDLLPDDIRYWDHLIPSPKTSATLPEYIENELGEAWRSRLSASSAFALSSLAMTFGAPALVPYARLQQLERETLVPALESLSKVDDHFSLEGVFEICAGRCTENDEFVALGDKVLDRLFADKNKLSATCSLFGAAFVVTTAHLAEHETLGRRPVYWWRVAAVAHASLITRLCAHLGFKADEITKWSMRVAGETYLLSVLNDFAVEPQWRPEWILTHFLVADVFGRALGTLHRIGLEQAPASWREKIDKAHEWIIADGLDLLTHCPAVLEGVRRPKLPTLAEFEAQNFTAATTAYFNLKAEPSIRNLLIATPLIEAFGLPSEMMQDIFHVLERIRNETHGESDDHAVTSALSIISRIAVLAANKEMADGVAEICLSRVRSHVASEPIIQTVTRSVECSAAIPDQEASRASLAARLEVLAFTLPATETIGSLVAIMQRLIRLQPVLSSSFGKAMAAARLGFHRTNRPATGT